MKYYIIAGEASGDLHAANLIKEIKKLDAHAECRCWGGDLSRQAGGNVVKDYKDLAFMGLFEVIANLKTILHNISFCKNDINTYNPDVVVFVDYPGFNVRIAKWAKANGYKTVYFISPKVWAWNEKRAKTLKRILDKMLVILPFEKKYFKEKWDWDVEYVGNPLVEMVDEYKAQHPDNFTNNENKELVALLPGSRKQEIKHILPTMVALAKSYPEEKFVVAKAPNFDVDFYQPYIKDVKNISLSTGKNYDLLAEAKLAVVCSGTATLETALLRVPQIVCYKGFWLSFLIGSWVVKIEFVSLVNLILHREAVKELLQNDFTLAKVKEQFDLLLTNTTERKKMLSDYDELYKRLKTDNRNAATLAAEQVCAIINAKE